MSLLFGGRFDAYSWGAFRKDVTAGVIVGIVAIPLAMAFAIASGVKPEYGICTTIIGGILISLFGGSKFQIGGPTGAFVPILLSVVLTYGYDNLLVAGFMAGVLLALMGIFKLGALISYIPRPVTIGFTSGIAVTIFSGQIANFLGLRHLHTHDSFLANMWGLAKHLYTVNGASVTVAVLCLGVMLAAARYIPRVPGSFLGLAVSTVVASIFFANKVSTIGSTYGAIPNHIPTFRLLNFSPTNLEHLLGPAFVIAMLGGIESLLSAVVADGMTGTKHHSNRELIGQGIANIITPLFGGIPATGAIARTATNIKNGAVSPLSGVTHGIFVLLTLLVLAPLASHIPLASMAPILMLVAWNMSERKEFAHILKTRTSDSLVLLATFLLTVFANLTLAVGVGLGLSVLLFTKRMSQSLQIQKVLPDRNSKNERVRPHAVTATNDCPQMSIFTVEGPLFFGAAQTFEQTIMSAIHIRPIVLILRMGKVPFLDTTGASILACIVKDFTEKGGTVLISGMNPQPTSVLRNTGLYATMGEDCFFERTGDAINKALTKLNHHQCVGCKHLAFKECHRLSGTSLLHTSESI